MATGNGTRCCESTRERALEAEPHDRAALGELAPALARPPRRRHRGLVRALGAHVTRQSSNAGETDNQLMLQLAVRF